MKRLVVMCVLLAGVAAQAQPGATGQRIEGRVTKVTDGDSLWVRPGAGGRPVEVRLLGIDAPEGCQAWGPQARRALEGWVAGRQVTLHTTGVDDHGRTLARVSVDGVDVNQRLVEEGHAWSYRFRRHPGPYANQERSAQSRRLGLHAAGDAVLPRDFRRRHGPCATG